MVHIIQGKQVGPIGFGLMRLTMNHNPPSNEQAFAAMRAALKGGCNYWNAAEFYGPPERNSMTLLKEYYEKYPEDADKVVLNVKGATNAKYAPEASPEGVKKSVENCLRMLGDKGRIHQFGSARKDPNVPVETTVEAIASFVKAGKIGGVSMSEVSGTTIRKAAKAAKIDSVEIQLSLWDTAPLTNGICQACYELGITVIAYAPLGHGMFTGKIKSPEDIPEGDYRRTIPRFQPENFAINIKLVEAVTRVAEKKGCTPGQVAINWVVALNKRPNMPVIIPIPGATTVERVEENSVLVDLTEEDMAEIEELLASFPSAGERYSEYASTFLDKEQ